MLLNIPSGGKCILSLPIQEGIFLRTAVVLRERIDLPGTAAPSPARITDSGSLSPLLYPGGFFIQPEIHAH